MLKFLSISLLVFALTGHLQAQDRLFITEFMADNSTTLLDQDGDASDWIEIYNTGPETASLAGWHLTDDPDNPALWTFPATNLAGGKFLIVFASGKNRAVAGQQLHANFQLGSAGEYLALVKPDGVIVAHDYSPEFPAQLNGVSYGVAVSVTTNVFIGSGTTATWRVPHDSSEFPAGWTGTNFDDSAWPSGGTGIGFGGAFAGSFQTDIGGSMRNVNATALVRIPFHIPEEDLPLLDQLTLRMKYDDGFVACLNGVEIARRNAPAMPAWNSAATDDHPDANAAQFEDIDVSPFIHLVQEGDNVLAIQGLNLSAADTNFLILPELTGRTADVSGGRYYSAPTPGKTNSAAYLGVVADTKFSVDRGFFSAPFTVALTTATAGAEIRFTTNGSPPSAVSGMIYASPITVDRSMVLRAIASKPGFRATGIDTHTYIFPGNAVAQSLQSATNTGFPAAWAGTAADYAMDPTVTAPNAGQMEASLRSLPSVFITTSISNLFDATKGIYANPTQHGLAWERPAALEMVDTNGQTEFQLGCGLRIQGAFFRAQGPTRKHSFRVLFKGAYGPGRLDHDVFKEAGAAQDFDGLVFRANANDGYSWATMAGHVQFIRDEFGRRLLLDMRHPSARGTFVHLYLDGLYWGLYNLTEHPNEDFSASYLGGEAKDWDANNAGDVKNGDLVAWNNFINQVIALATYADYQKLQGNNSDGSRNPAYTNLYDKVDYMDYMLVNIWGGNWDWPNKNFWFGRKRTADSTGFKFYNWDYEDTLDSPRSPLNMVSPRSTVENSLVGAPHYRLKNFGEYKLDFADRVQKFFFNGGLLTPQALTNRYRQLADSIQSSVIAESARWGDDNVTPPYGLMEWTNERNYILTTYLPQRTGITLQQFISSGLYPAVSAPAFSRFGGAVPAGFGLAITNPNAGGTIFYTLDGSDPRVPGTGAVSGGAQTYSIPIIINTPTQVRARVLVGAAWSALVEAVFFPPQDLSRLALTEIMYHAPAIGATNGDEFDFIELKNTGTNTLNLSGLLFTNGVAFAFTNGTMLAPGQFFVLARNAAALGMKYPGVAVNGLFSGELNNGGENLTLVEALGSTVFSINYDDEPPWPVAPDALGFSLVPKNPGESQAPDEGAKWRASASAGGSPGADDPLPDIPAVVINEILTHTDPPQLDGIELCNPTIGSADISGWYLTDDAAAPKKYRIPDGTILPAGGRVYFDESQFNPTPGAGSSFALSSAGDDVYLFSSATNGVLTGYNHGVVFGAAFNGVSFGRYVNSAGEEQFPPQTAPTLGSPNSGPRIGPVVINEINYHPPPGGDEFVELLNLTATNVPLFSVAFPTNTWKLNGVGFTFPTNTSLGSSQMLLLVATNPAVFRARYGVAANVQIFGPVSGNLQDSGENLELQVPDAPNTNGVVPDVTIEAVRYNDKAPWPAAADGTGLSLQRVAASAYGNDPANWIAAAPTPGLFYGTSDTDGDGIPDNWETLHGTLVNIPDADADPDGDGISNWQEYLAGTDPHDANSALRMSGVTVAPGNIGLQFFAASNHSYSVLGKTNLSDPVWTRLADVPAQPTNGVVNVTDPGLDSGARFYRLVTPAQP
jgi:hypothetical protein